MPPLKSLSMQFRPVAVGHPPTVDGEVKRESEEEQREREDIEEAIPHKEKWSNEHNAWTWLKHNSKWGNDCHVFDSVEIAHDGGLSEIGLLSKDMDTGVPRDKLWYASRPFSSAMLIVFVVYNVYYLISLDVGVIQEHLNRTETSSNATAGGSIENDYLISKTIIDVIWVGNTVDPKVWITGLELLILTWMILVLLQDVFAACFKKGYHKWKGIAEICWVDLPQLSIFSAIKLLQYIVPQKVSYDLFVIFFYIADSTEKWKQFGLFLISRPFFLVVGMDMFLIKYRLVYQHMAVSFEDLHFNDITAGLIFLNQCIGVCNLAFTIRDRLYRFVFAGEEGVMEKEEDTRRDVWEAFVAFKVFNNVGSLRDDGAGNKVLNFDDVPANGGEHVINYPKWKAVCLMLSWCDDDFQTLSLNDFDPTSKADVAAASSQKDPLLADSKKDQGACALS